MKTVLLDTTPISLWCHPKPVPARTQIELWLDDLKANGWYVILPEITYYEFRREVLRRKNMKSLLRLRQLRKRLYYQALTTPIMDRAAELWAQVRQSGLPTAGDAALDVDVILAATALYHKTNVIVATSNPAHLVRFVPADRWELIAP